ncbi:DUF6339 family protein [Cellulosimicrobium cellulans]|uniref:DUF6339 family protein n=1 Tax=Cellulosimicrobium cellulans TaxID=1710 RepID=UPI00130D7CE4|nr:DUF6339 family protein [Cellulosimicrobium cellulans]
MSTLYPRLLPADTEALFTRLPETSAGAAEPPEALTTARAVYAASGGMRVHRDELLVLRDEVRRAAVEHGFPERPGLEARNGFDRRVARILHARMGLTAGEASQRQVWAYLALVLLPDVCVWRFPPNDDGRYVADRYKGTDLTRHALARLWWRAHVLRDGTRHDDPYWMLEALGEADLDQVMARRRSVAATPSLVRTVVRVTAESTDAVGRDVLRDLLKRLLRLTAFLDLDWLDDEQLRALVLRERAVSIANLTG